MDYASCVYALFWLNLISNDILSLIFSTGLSFSRVFWTYFLIDVAELTL